MIKCIIQSQKVSNIESAEVHQVNIMCETEVNSAKIHSSFSKRVVCWFFGGSRVEITYQNLVRSGSNHRLIKTQIGHARDFA